LRRRNHVYISVLEDSSCRVSLIFVSGVFFDRDNADNRISKGMKAIWGAQAASLYPIGCQPMATRSVVATAPATIDMKRGGD
jgi:hypothetical protein